MALGSAGFDGLAFVVAALVSALSVPLVLMFKKASEAAA